MAGMLPRRSGKSLKAPLNLIARLTMRRHRSSPACPCSHDESGEKPG
jgi:hypothetical protein